MKKFFIVPAVIALAFVCSCNKEQEEEGINIDITGEELTEFKASLPGTKTYLGEATGEVGSREWPNLWSNGDVISVNGVTSVALSTGDGYVGTDYAIFHMASAVSGPFYAAYPASAVSGYSAGSATITIPATQTFVAGSYDPASYIMLGKSNTETLSFNPMMGLIQLTTTAPASGTLYIKSITVEPVGEEKMSGSFTTTENYAGITGGSSSAITISAASGTTKTFGTVFTFAIPAQNYASGVRFRITAVPNADGTGAEQTMVFSKQSGFNVETGKLYPLTAPAFKESAVAISLIRALTSSSIQIRWNGANASNNKKKVWRIHAYTNSACTAEFGSGWTIPADPDSGFWDKDNSYLTFVVGGLARGTEYWFKVEDVQNGIMSAASSITTQSFSQVSMPESISTTGVVFAEDFNELPWGGTVCFRRSAGFRPSNTSSFSNLSTEGANFYRWDSWFSFRASALNTALTSSRLNNWMSQGDVYAHPGHIKLGTGSTAGWIVTPAFPVVSGKNAVVNVTLNATKYNDSAQSEYAIAVLNSSLVGSGSGYRAASFTWPDTSDETLYQTVSFSSNSEWQSRTAEGLVLNPGDRIVFGRRNGGGDTNPRLFVNSFTVEVTGIEDDLYKIYDVATLQYFMTNIPDAAIVTADINMSDQSFTTITGYTGTLYGNGHTISGLTVPMFDELKGTVRDLTLNSTLNITSKHADGSGVGIFAKKMTNNSELIGCTSKGSLVYCPSSAFTSKEQRVGGLVGYLNLGSLTDCRNEASVTLNDNGKSNDKAINLGGIAGQTYNTNRNYMTSCTNAGNVTNNCNTSAEIFVGGVCGKPWRTTFTDCKNENKDVSITITNTGPAGKQIAIGGLFGMLQEICILDGECYNTEAVLNTGTSSTSVRIGGFVGQADKNNTYNASSNKYHYNDGTVTENSGSTDLYVGGFCGYANNANVDISYCRNNGDIKIVGGTRNEIYVGGVIGLTTACVPFNYVQNSGDIIFDGLDISGQVFVGGVHGGWSSNVTDAQTVTGCRNSGAIKTKTTSANTDLKSSSESKKWTFIGGISGVGASDHETEDHSDFQTSEYFNNLFTVTGKTFNDCVNNGDIVLYLSLRFCAGGVIAWSDHNPPNCICTKKVQIFKHSSSGYTEAGRSICGGVVGICNLSTLSDMKFSGNLNTYGTTPMSFSGGIVGITMQNTTFSNCKVGGSIRGAGSGQGRCGLFCNHETKDLKYTFTSCIVKNGTTEYSGGSSATVSDNNLTIGKCVGVNVSASLATGASLPSVGSID